ncbi:OTU domain-containing protein OS=Streptomyces fumanus OX=67302 GN=GCM10018772_56770 PE=4 SV=1 [Streptomyces fumanus]
MQGGLDTVQALLAGGREATLWDDLLSPDGYVVHLANPIGWALSDVVRIRLRAVLTSDPEIGDFRPETGLQVTATAPCPRRSAPPATPPRRSRRDGSAAGAHASGTGAVGLGEGRHRGVTRAGTETGIGTVYAWDGTRLVTYRFRVDIGIERVNKPGGAVTGPLVRWYRLLDAARSAPFTDTVTGCSASRSRRGLSEFRPVYGPRAAPDPRPLPPLPGDAYVSGVAMDGVERAALRLAGRVFGEHAAGGTSRASLALLRLLTPRQMAEHVRRASQAAPLLLTDSLLDPADPSRRAALYLRGALYDLEVIGPVAGTGTGRYSKYQKGTSVNAADDHWRASATASASGSGVVQAPEQADARPPHTLGGDTGASRTTAGGQGGTGSENQRREEHLKQQGPVYSVLLRWRGRLEARPYSRPLLGPAGRPGKKTLYGETFTGDVYAELFQSEVEELRARHRQVPDPAGDARRRPRSRTASPSFDLAGLLADACEPGAGAHRLHQAVARTISAGTDGTPETVTFHLDRTALLRRVHRDVLRWAVDALGARLAGDHAAGPGREAARPSPGTGRSWPGSRSTGGR